MNRNERTIKLQATGVDTTKHFNVELDNVSEDATVLISINGVKYNISQNSLSDLITKLPSGAILDAVNEEVCEFEKPMCNIKIDDPIAKTIIENGYVKNTKLHRRFVMAQTFSMLNRYSNDEVSMGASWNKCIYDLFPYKYQFDVVADELKVLAELKKADKDTYDERKRFFTREVIYKLCKQYLKEEKKFIDRLVNRNGKLKKCKGKEYITLPKYGHVFVDDISSKVISPLEHALWSVEFVFDYTKSLEELTESFNNFVKLANKLPYDTTKSSVWRDAYKGSGAYYTLKNMIMFHNIKLEGMTREESLKELRRLLDEDYKHELWRFHFLLIKVIEDNNFNFKESIEKCNNGEYL